MVQIDKSLGLDGLVRELAGKVFKKMNENGSYDYFFVTDFHRKSDGNIEVQVHEVFCKSEKHPDFSYFGMFWMVLDSFIVYMEYHEESTFDEMICKMENAVHELYKEQSRINLWKLEEGIIKMDEED